MLWTWTRIGSSGSKTPFSTRRTTPSACTVGQRLRLGDAGGRVDAEGVGRAGAGREGERAVALVDARLGVVVQRRDGDGQRLAVLEQHAAQLGRLAQRRARLEVDAVGQPGDEVAALGEELHVELRQHQRDRPDDGLVGAVR